MFYESIKTLCREQGRTIESVVNEAGLTLSTYNSLKRLNNLPRADIAVKIAQVLGTTVEFLVTGKNFCNSDSIKLAELKKLLEQANKIVF